MRYYLIAGEASGDLHASHLMRALKNQDEKAEFRFFGGDLMASVGGTLVKHYRELAYMGAVAVILHLRTILRNMKLCKSDIVGWKPDVVILVDYPGFNLNIAKYLKSHTTIPVYYYISPKIWAWKEYRIKNIKRDIDQLFSILPFEVDFFERKHNYPIHYVGNPTATEVNDFLSDYSESSEEFCKKNHLQIDKPILALLSGSRKQEIDKNLPVMIEAAKRFNNYQYVIAAAPGIDDNYYNKYIEGTGVSVVRDQTYPLLAHAHVALVTSGTATLETALFKVPQVVCYATIAPKLVSWLRKIVLKVKYVSLVNLIANKEVVTELIADSFTTENVVSELKSIIDGTRREQMLYEYDNLANTLGHNDAPVEAARIMVEDLIKR